MKKAKRILKTTAIIFAVLILLLSLNLLISRKWISVTSYGYRNQKLTTSFKAVQLTDLHNYQFGKRNARLIQKVREEQPDVIFMTGDMLNDDEERTDILENVIRELSEIAPVYASLGNHEAAYINRQGNERMIQIMEDAGAVVLDKEFVDTEIAGQRVRIGGVYGYVLAEEWQDGSEQRFMEQFENTDRFKILLSHMPEGLLLWKSMERWDVDLVFSGHVHGGQIRLPFIGGIYDPEEGFFPTYTKGMFVCGHGTMILSGGLGSSRGIPRVNNLPELVVCELKTQ